MYPTKERVIELVKAVLAHEVYELGNSMEVLYTHNAESVPSTGKAIHAMWRTALDQGKPFRVYSGDCQDHRMYFGREVNLMYRFVHDVDHAVNYEFGRGTTKYQDELYLNCGLALRVYKSLINEVPKEEALACFFGVYHDTVGQAKFYKEHGVFIVDQLRHTQKLLDECSGVRLLKSGQVRLAYQVMLGYLGECGL